MTPFKFEPEAGLLDRVAYPTDPDSEDAARGQLQRPLTQIATYLNGVLQSESGAEHIGAAALYKGDVSGATVGAKLLQLRSEILALVAGSVPDGSITAAKLAVDIILDGGEY